MKVEKILGKVKLRHLDLLVAPEPDYAEAMSQVYGYKNNWFTRKWNFIKKFKSAYVMVNTMRGMDPSKLELPEKPSITMPPNIDFITFQAMMELQAHLNQGIDEKQPSEAIAKTIAIACFQSHYDLEKYDSDSMRFKDFVTWILNQSYLEMMPIFNAITKALEESVTTWNERFFSVEVTDEDYDQAGGSRMGQFNVLTTIKSLCEDFNVNYIDAWQISYNFVQTNSYAKATQYHIQEQMQRLKEIKMKQQRNSN